MESDIKGLRNFYSWLQSNQMEKGKSIALTGLTGSSKGFLVSYLRKRLRGTFLIIVPHLRNAQILFDDIIFFDNELEGNLFLFPPWETLPYDDISPHPEIIRQRVKCLHSLLKNKEIMIISPIKAAMQNVFSLEELEASSLYLKRGEEIDREKFILFLKERGYSHVNMVEEPGDFSIRGAIIDIYTPLYEHPLRLEFIGDQLESIRKFEIENQRSIKNGFIEEAVILPAKDILNCLNSKSLSNIFNFLGPNDLIFIEEGEEVKKEINDYSQMVKERYEKAYLKRSLNKAPELLYLQDEEVFNSLKRFHILYLEAGPILPEDCKSTFSFSFEHNEDIRSELKALFINKEGDKGDSPLSYFIKRLKEWQKMEYRCFIISRTSVQTERLRDLLFSYGEMPNLDIYSGFKEALDKYNYGINLLVGSLSSGFRNPEDGWVIVTEEEIFGERRKIQTWRGRKFSGTKGAQFLNFRELKEGDFIVHLDYGIGRYLGLKNLKIGGYSNDYLLLEYLDGDKLYLPVDRLNLVQRYIGGDGKPPRLDKLGGSSWQKTKKRVKSAISEMLKEIIDLYAVREVFEGYSFPPLDQFYREFEATFEYEETPDQIKAIEDVMKDMGSPKPMDRLICGDVGFGKTEVAIRAAYRAVMATKQVALLVPTTVLAQQHYHTFKERFKNYPVVIEVLTRFKSSKEKKEILERLRQGKVDILIGTHRILQKDVIFRDLGLIIIDEEHRFGVSQKERLKQIRKLADVITLSATPIPRTLHMSLSGIRDLSIIQTPPENRLSIRTFVVRYNDELIEDVVRREFERGGQVFFVQPHIKNIYHMANYLRHLIPDAIVAVAHGQMRGKELERVMLDFINRKINLLVCTNIIGAGLDIPTANTILINHAEQFGLADLYQLRGRVGRGSEQAYAYLLIPEGISISRDSLRRLRAIQEFSELGAGFRLAMEDLEIRGAGNILGKSQSGHINAIGLELYTQMIQKAIKELKGEPVVEEITPKINLRLSAIIPEEYVEDPMVRLNLYRRLSLSRSEEEVEEIREELRDRFGNLPDEVNNLLEVIKIKILLTKLAIIRLEENPSQLVLTFHEKTTISPDKIVGLDQREYRVRFTPDLKLILQGLQEINKDPLMFTKKILQVLS